MDDDLKLMKTVDLPNPALPGEKTAMPCPPPCPPKGVSHGMCAVDGSLYVLAGPLIYRFKTPALSLESSTELPKPEMPQAEPPKAGN